MSTPLRTNRPHQNYAYALGGALLRHFYWICLALLAALLGATLFNFVLADL